MSRTIFKRVRRPWSIARRFFLISFLMILAQAQVSTAISDGLFSYFLTSFLEDKMSRQLSRTSNVVTKRLDNFSVERAFNCCTLNDYQFLLRGLTFEDGKTAWIYGSAGLQAASGAGLYYSHQDLLDWSNQVIAEDDGFLIVNRDGNQAIALKAVKLPGGEQSGFYIYLRPVYSMPLLVIIGRIKFWSEIVLMLVLAVLMLGCLRLIFRPVRAIQRDLAAVELNELDSAFLDTNSQPSEFLPLLQEFNHMVERLRLASSRQKQFASTISHEFRTPLTVISGFIQSVLNRETMLSSSSIESLEVANRESLRINRMLSDLLDLIRAESNQLQILRESFESMASANEVVKLARKAYPARKIVLESELSASLLAIGDSDRLIQCLSNLIENAVKYSDSDSEVVLRVNATAEKVIFNVVDHGQGIPEDQHQLIFDRFKRAQGVNLRRGESSSGLGLSIVKMFVLGMGGEVSVQSTVGKGSCFSIALNRANSPG